ncbi:MAG: hypothetical protein AAF500_01785 [Myxococcota bacterium]
MTDIPTSDDRVRRRIAGFGVDVGAGMPMLLRAGQLSRRGTESTRELTITPGLMGLTIGGRF